MSRYAFTSNKEKTELLDLMYPIGSIYMSSNNTNPSTIFGGYWRKIESKFLFGANSSGSDLGSEGGERTHTLTSGEVPAHTHTRGSMEISGNVHFSGWGGNEGVGQVQSTGGVFTKGGDTWLTTHTSTAGWGGSPDLYFTASRNWSGETSSVGGGGSHNNMPPYLTVNIWERFFPAHEGETYIFDGIEVYCLLGVESTDHPLFVDKNHDLSYYVNGSDYVDSKDYNTSPGTFGYEWGGYNTTTGIIDIAIGSGLSNTNRLIASNLQPHNSGWYVVWDKIEEFRATHSNNWFIPSKDELTLIYEAKSNLSNLSLNSYTGYWSSSEYSSADAWCQYFSSGNQGDYPKYGYMFRSRLCYTI